MTWKAAIAAGISAVMLVIGIGVSKAEAATFTDVSSSQWYYTSIEKLARYDVINGYQDGQFKPQKLVTRAQAASIIANALRLNKTKVAAPAYRDITRANGHYGAVAALTKLGVFQNGEKFYPNEQLTRKQMAKILVEAFHLKSSGIVTYTDVPPKSWAYQYVGVLGALGVTTTQGDFEPNAPVTRAHLAAFIERTIDLKRKDNNKDIWDSWKNW